MSGILLKHNPKIYFMDMLLTYVLEATVCIRLGRPRVFSWVLLPELLKAQFRKGSHTSGDDLDLYLGSIATIEARGDLAPLQDPVSKVKVLFCADATPIKACLVILMVIGVISKRKTDMLYQRCGRHRQRAATFSSTHDPQKRAC